MTARFYAMIAVATCVHYVVIVLLIYYINQQLILIFSLWKLKKVIVNNLLTLVMNSTCFISLLSWITINSLSQPLKLGHFITVIKILVAVRLGFQSCQFNIGRYGDV